MSVYTWTANEPRITSKRASIRNGAVLLLQGKAYDLTAEEIQYLTSRGLILTPGGTPDVVAAGPLSESSFRVPMNFLVGGLVGAETTVPDALVVLGESQTGQLVEALCKLKSGTSVDVQIRKNDVVVAGAAGTVDGTVTSLVPDALTFFDDGDRVDFVLSDPVGDPADLTVAVVIEYTITV